ncbi:MAG: SsrA-binding protein SmpB [Neisseriales bacterium]|uniref:SsrA-binding protein n=1 Tax=Aquella oligotrophica TaxID=2067065 RepID=A0A2I7N7Z6_9NEIS|nr:SsrA-binding protein SmpB [Aquella oligotrophica]AUR52587.1 SsrA-binding protein [Aquella oligotrophica]TXI92438.1 MAG: SsrA-binding protein SmpB [Neisseriales bacterium]
MSIISNKKAYHDYFIEEKFEAGVVLEGWEVKAIRAGKGQLKDSYVKIKNNEIWLIGFNVNPMISTSTHIRADASRLKKLLLHRREIDRLIGKVEQRGYSLIALDLHYKKGKVKAEIALAKGKKLHDKRATEKEREGQREAAQAIKAHKRL